MPKSQTSNALPHRHDDQAQEPQADDNEKYSRYLRCGMRSHSEGDPGCDCIR